MTVSPGSAPSVITVIPFTDPPVFTGRRSTFMSASTTYR